MHEYFADGAGCRRHLGRPACYGWLFEQPSRKPDWYSSGYVGLAVVACVRACDLSGVVHERGITLVY